MIAHLDTIESAFLAGRHAYQTLIPQAYGNVYPAGTPQADAWRKGWRFESDLSVQHEAQRREELRLEYERERMIVQEMGKLPFFIKEKLRAA